MQKGTFGCMRGQAGGPRSIQKLGFQLSSATCWILNGWRGMYVLLTWNMRTDQAQLTINAQHALTWNLECQPCRKSSFD